MKQQLDKVRARQERLREFNNRTNELGMATPGLGDIWNDIDRLIRALEYARERAHHYAQLCENGGLNVHAEKANEITDAEITAILEGK